MKKIILYSMFGLSGLFTVNASKADDVNVWIDFDYCNGKDDGVYGNLSDCKWYYQCYANRTSAKQCLDGLIFDWNTNVCQFPWFAFNPANCP